MKNLLHTSIVSVLLVVASTSTKAGVAYPDPPGGWTYIYTGDQDTFGTANAFDSLDGTWSKDNGSSQWDGSKIGGIFNNTDNHPGGVMTITEGNTTYLRIQDTGEPRDYVVPGTTTRYTDPSNRKIYFGHSISNDGGLDNALDDGITLSFRARIPAPGKATGPLDPLHRNGQQGANRTNTLPYPASGDGYVTSDGGKGNFTIKQRTGIGGVSGAIAVSLTQTNDTTGGALTPTTNFRGLTMNEFAGNVVSGNVNFGQGSATNVIAFDPTDWHELWIVYRKDPANIGTHQGFFYLDGALVPSIFRITAGTGSDYGDSYLAIGSTATGQNSALDIDFVAYKSGAVFPQGALDNLPPEILNVIPARGSTFQSAADGISFTATAQATNSLPTNGFKLTLNGVNVSSGITVSGTPQNRTATFKSLVANTVYTGEIVVSDQAGRSETNRVSFDTFVEANTTVIEAEDYNFGNGACDPSGVPSPDSTTGGQFINNPAPSAFFNGAYINKGNNGYVDKLGAPNIDFLDTTAAGGTPANNAYRLCDPVGTQQSADSQRPKYAAALLPDYDLSLIIASEWVNYTRTFTAGKYNVYLRAGSSVNQQVQLDLVTGNRAAPNQTTAGVGVFNVLNTGAATVYGSTPLTDAFGNPVVVSLSGDQTLRLTALSANGNLRINYLVLVPVSSTTPTPPTIGQASPGINATGVPPDARVSISLLDGDQQVAISSIRLEMDGQQVSPVSTKTATGATITYAPSSLLQTNTTHSIRLIFADNGTPAKSYTNQWSFTVANTPIIPASYATPFSSVANSQRGFQIKIHKARNDADAALFPNNSARAEQQLAGLIIDAVTGLPYDNEAAGGSNGIYTEPGTINYEQAATGTGYFGDDTAYPGIDPGAPDFIAMTATTYLKLTAGVYRLGVRRDDGFKLTTGPTVGNTNLVVGILDGGGGNGLPAGSTEFEFVVTADGIYAFRLLYWEGTGGASIEWFSVNRTTGQRILVNAPGGIEAYQTRVGDGTTNAPLASGNLLLVTDRADLEVGTDTMAGYLRGLGYNVVVSDSGGTNFASEFRTLDAAKIARLETNDLVIVDRPTSSGDFANTGEPEQWNGLNVPVLLLSPFLARNNPARWNWANASQAAGNATNLTFSDPTHPIVAGLNTDMFAVARNLDRLTTTDLGNGKLIAVVAGTTNAAIAEWNGSGFYIGTSGQFHPRRRVYFGVHNYHETPPANTAVPFGGPSFWSDISANGKKILAQAVAYTMSEPPPPKITAQPTAQTAQSGGSVTFSVTATGTGTLTYQWRLNGTNIAGATSATLTISSVQVSNAGSYTVVVSNANGSVTSAAVVLTVTPASELRITSVSAAGSSVTMTWTGGTPPYLVQRKNSLSDTNWVNVLTTPNQRATVPLAGAAAFFRVSDRASTTVTPFTISLTGGAQVPPVTTTASGLATLSLEGTRLSFVISYQGLSGVPTQMHFHGPASSTATAPPVVDLTALLAGAGTSATIVSSITVTADQITALKAGLAYLNIHTVKFPDGEIRGQITVAP